jgi:hypothetical protein
METKFQTSFIPKKPTVSAIGSVSSAPRHRYTSSIFMTIATIIFIISILGTGAVFAYKQYLINAQETYKIDLATREKQFNTDLIEQLKGQNIKIDDARSLLANHVALSQIFDVLSRLTIENVSFKSLDVSSPTTGSDGIKISLQGYGTSLSAVAYQSDVLSQLDQYGLRKVVKNPILSNPTLNTNGAVSFGFTAVIDPSSMLYENLISPQTDTSGSNTGTTNAGTNINGNSVSTSTGTDATGNTGGTVNPFTSQ